MKKTLLKASLAIGFAELFNALNINAQKYLLPEWSNAFSMLFMRTAFGMLFFWVLDRFSQKEKVAPRDLLFMLTAGACSLTSYMTFYLLGVEKSSPVDSSLIMSCMPVAVLILAVLFYREKLSILKILGVICGIGGTVFIILMQARVNDAEHFRNSVLGNLFCVFSALSYGVYLIVNKRLATRYAPFTMLKWIFTGAFIMSIPLLWIAGWDVPAFRDGFHVIPWAVILFVLIFPTGLTYLLIPFALKNLQATTVAMYDYEVPVVASLVGILLGQAHFGWYQPVAAMLIFLGVYLVSKENKRMRRLHDDSLPI